MRFKMQNAPLKHESQFVWPKGLIKMRLEGAIFRTISLHSGIRTLFKSYPMRFCNRRRIFIDVLQSEAFLLTQLGRKRCS